MVRGLWGRQIEAIIDVKLGDTDTNLYKYEPIAALLAKVGNYQKDKHSKNCHDQRKHLPPFVLSMDIILEREALAVLLQLSWFMAERREEPLSQV